MLSWPCMEGEQVKRYVLVGVVGLILLSGCAAHVPEVAQIGPDTYFVAASGKSEGRVKVRLYKVAGDYCAQRRKVMLPVSISSVPSRRFVRAASAELTFRCLCEGDAAPAPVPAPARE